MRYSKSENGFYSAEIHGDNIPSDAVEISADRHAALLAGQSGGRRIVGDDAGHPVLADAPVLTRSELNAALTAGVDNTISEIYSRFTRFETEYVQRENAARAFRAAGNQGDAGVWVNSFATNAGMNSKAAADLIIGQADGMRGALQALGALRMRKYGIAAAADAVAAQAVHDDIVAKAKAIAAAL